MGEKVAAAVESAVGEDVRDGRVGRRTYRFIIIIREGSYMSLALLAAWSDTSKWVGVEMEGSYMSLALLAAWSTRVDWGGNGGFL